VAHGGMNSKRREPRRQIYIFRKYWFDHLFFENSDKLNKKNLERLSTSPTNRWLKSVCHSTFLPVPKFILKKSLAPSRILVGLGALVTRCMMIRNSKTSGVHRYAHFPQANRK
jgi:hypothetical protein